MKLNVHIILFFLLLTPIFTFKCGANKIKDIKINKVSQPENRRRLQTYYTPIKIKLDYSYLEYQKNSEELTNNLKKILDKTITYFSKLLSVLHTDFKLFTWTF